MKPLIPTALALAAMLTAPAFAQDMTLTTSGTQAGSLGSPDYFVGTVYVEPVFGAKEASPVSAGKVTFLPGARSNWHDHPAGQQLVVIEGSGWTMTEGGEKHAMHAGDVVWCPPGVKHWHGATDTTAVTHYAIQVNVDGSAVNWMEPVSDADYLSALAD
ncbi:(R)-mandelonitrile lyase [Acuticoccus kandeliae]|uniref:(R)-mandelonitrile lyase n=1 Tax=Acuticoccus kandeliae TaxID=2073160 RepID=UPI001FE706E7|nr:cupin domain-containing protein [Acuticoccus kandeliae]